MLRLFLLLSLWLTATFAVYPSSKIVYYLHKTPATWASARDTCARYSGHLVNVSNATLLKADIEILDNWLGWEGAFNGLLTDVWAGLYRLSDPNKGGTDSVIWHPCLPYPSRSSSSNDIASRLLASPNYCTSMDYVYGLQPTACDIKLPYICQVEEGQCWFLPVENKSFKSQISPAITMNGDLNTCARNCRNDINSTGHECWGFMVKDGTCMMYRDTQRHAFIRNPGKYLSPVQEVTSFFKICTGGDITTMKPVTEDNSVKPAHENCTSADDTTESWDNGVCYCDCDQPPVIMDPEYLVLSIGEKIGRIVQDLKVNAKDTSASYRKLNSIEDDRPSAQSIGAAGIIILAVVFGGLLLFDLDILITYIWRKCCRRENTELQMT